MYFIYIDKNKWINKYGKGEVDIKNTEVLKLQWFNSEQLPRFREKMEYNVNTKVYTLQNS